MVKDIFSIELLLGIIVALAGFQLVIIGYFARKYITKIDSNAASISKVITEHCIFHKNETGIKCH